MCAGVSRAAQIRKRIAKPVLASILIGSVAFGTAGCTAPKTSQHEAVAKPKLVSVSQTYGDVIADGTVTDSLGTYEKTTINPDGPAMKYDKSIVDPKTYSFGFDDTQLASAQRYVAKFVAEEGTDSAAVDSDAGWAAWKSGKADLYLNPAQTALILGTKSTATNTDRPMIIVNNNNSKNPQLIRDGKPRFKTNKILVSSINGETDAAIGSYVWISGTATTDYRVNDAVAVAWIKKYNPSDTDAMIKAQLPALYENSGKNETKLNSIFSFGYGLVRSGSSWKIGGFENNVAITLENLNQ